MFQRIDTHLPLSQYDISFIREQKLFENLGEHQIESLLAESQIVKLKRGDLLYSKNQTASHFFILITGQIKLTRASINGGEKVINIIKPRQIFAETALLTNHQSYSENAWAINSARVIAIRTDIFFTFLKESSTLCLDLMERMSGHVQWLVDEIDRITLHNASYRLINYLLEEVEFSDRSSSEFQLNTPKIILASRLSITPETLSRILKGLAAQNLISHHNGGMIILKDIPRLRDLLSAEASNTFYG